MNFIFCVIYLSASALFLDFAKADKEQDLLDRLRNRECKQKSQECQKQMVAKPTVDEILGLCNAKPLPTTASKCMMDCQMRQYKWLNDKGFQKDKYIQFIKESELGHDQTYVQAAEKAANLCKDKKDPGKDSCKTASLILNCLQDEGNKLQKINIGYGLFYVEPFFLEFK